MHSLLRIGQPRDLSHAANYHAAIIVATNSLKMLKQLTYWICTPLVKISKQRTILIEMSVKNIGLVDFLQQALATSKAGI